MFKDSVLIMVEAIKSFPLLRAQNIIYLQWKGNMS